MQSDNRETATLPSGGNLPEGPIFKNSRYEPVLLPVGHDKGQQRDGPGSFDGQCYLSLVFRAGSRNATGHNLPPLSQKITQRLGILVLDFQIGIGTEPTEFSSVEKFLLGPG